MMSGLGSQRSGDTASPSTLPEHAVAALRAVASLQRYRFNRPGWARAQEADSEASARYLALK